MRECKDGQYIEIPSEIIDKMLSEYLQSVDYGEAINEEIRKKYTESEEFAILRQKDLKPEEYATYYAYCEKCKAYVKAKKAEYTEE